MASGLVNMFRIPELRKRIVYTLALLAAYRVGIFVSTPGVDRGIMRDYLQTQTGGGGFLGLFNFFSGGALEQLSVFALGIMPYVTASIIMQLMTVVVPSLERLQKEGVLAETHGSFASILSSYDDTYRLFDWLNTKFNGDFKSPIFTGEGPSKTNSP